jgi:SAM-dependent methyltransferase
MIAAAGERLGDAAAVAVADAESLPFRDRSFEIVVSSSSFHFWPRPLEGLRECRRVLTAGGTLVITDWCDDFLFCRLCDRLLRLRYGRSHRVYGEEECRELLESAGFEVVSLDRYKISWLWGLMTAVAKPRLEVERRPLRMPA